MNAEKASKLNEIKEEIKNLLREAEMVLRREGIIWQRARSYWYAHILGALDKEHEYLGGSMTTMQDTIEELAGEGEEDEESSVYSMRLTNTFSRVAAIPMRKDAGELREALAYELARWHTAIHINPERAESFWRKVKYLARMVGKTKEEVYQELQEDVDRMEDEEDLDLDRTSAKKGEAVNPWAVCHSQLGPEKNEKFESCVQDVKKKHKIKED